MSAMGTLSSLSEPLSTAPAFLFAAGMINAELTSKSLFIQVTTYLIVGF